MSSKALDKLDTATLLRLLEEQMSQNKELRQQLDKLQHQLSMLQNMLFGQKSERQKSKSDGCKKSETNPPTNNHNSPSNNTSDKKGNGRRKLIGNFERQKVFYELPEEKRKCLCCHRTLHCIGKEVCEQLDYIPARLIVKEHVRYKYACKCIASRVLTAPMPEQPIDKGLAGSGLLAEILVNKYEDHLPLYRQQKRWQRLTAIKLRANLLIFNLKNMLFSPFLKVKRLSHGYFFTRRATILAFDDRICHK